MNSTLHADVIDRLKDDAHDRLKWRIEEDPDTGCWIYTGAWEQGSGLGVLRVAGRVFTASRVAAWVYGPVSFDLFDTAGVRVYHHDCNVPACCNPDHLRVAAGSGAVNAALATLGRCRKPRLAAA